MSVNLFWPCRDTKRRVKCGKRARRGHKCEERDPFCAVEIHARIYCSTASTTRPLAPGRCGLSGATASGTPQSSWYPGRMHRAVGAPLFEGDFETGVTDRKNSFFLAAKEQKAESRGGGAARRGATRHGAPRSARKNIIYVRHDGRPIAHRFAPRPLFVLILLRSDIMHDGALNSPRYLKFYPYFSLLTIVPR